MISWILILRVSTPYIFLVMLRQVEVEAQPTRLIEISWILSFRVSTPYIFLVMLRQVEVDPRPFALTLSMGLHF